MRVNRSITKEEFKFIYAVEYGHRMWGRVLGLVFAVPAGYFLVKKAISGSLGKRLSVLFLMGGAQGLVGWWMVRSGLQVWFFVILLMHFISLCWNECECFHSCRTD